MPKRKIVFVTKALWVGGIESALVNLLKAFDYDRFDVTLLLLHNELDLLEQIDPHVTVKLITRENGYSHNGLYPYTEKCENGSALHKAMNWTAPIIKWVENVFFIRFVTERMQSESYDTCIIYSDAVAEIAVRSVHADKYLLFYHHGAMRHTYHDTVAYKRCEKIIAVSEHQAEALRQFVPVAADKIVAIHNITDAETIRSRADEFAVPHERYTVCTVGRFHRDKGMDLAVEAAAELVKKGFEDFEWIFVGDGPEMPAIRSLAQKLGVEKHVKLVGMQSNPYPYIKSADLYVQTSRFESFGLSIAEALSLGKTVIATKTNGAMEQLPTDMICEPDSLAIAKAILDAQNNVECIQIDFEEKNKQIMQALYEIIGE